MAKKKKDGTTKPSGLTIARNGNTYTLTWKRGDKDYGAGQQFQYSKNNGKWTNVTVGVAQTSVTLRNQTGMKSLQFRVQGRRKKWKDGKKTITPKWSGWATSGKWSAVIPTVQPVTYENESANSGTFGWSVQNDAKSTAILLRTETQTCYVRNTAAPPENAWGSIVNRAASGELTINEDTEVLAEGNIVRWFRVRSVGTTGNSAWKTQKHAYGDPNDAVLVSASAETMGSVTKVTAEWKDDYNATNPIDMIALQYVIAKPTDAQMSPPADGWSTAIEVKPNGAANKVVVNIENVVDVDECLWVRIKGWHDDDNNASFSNAMVAQYGALGAPTIDANPNFTSGDVAITITETTACNAAETVIFYRAADDPSNDRIVAILPHNTTSTTVNVPEIVGESESCFGAYAIVGTHTGTTLTSVLMRSATALDNDIAAVAPANVTVKEGPDEGTVRIGWEWSWSGATKAEISWSDKEYAWESTNEPSDYSVEDVKTTSWIIAGLEVGKRWFFKVRLIDDSNDKEIVGPWSEMVKYDLTTVPDRPALTLSKSVINEGGTFVARWAFGGDGASQEYAEIALVTFENNEPVYGEVIAHAETQTSIEVDREWVTGQTYNLAVRVTAINGLQTAWSEPVSLYVAEPVTIDVQSDSLRIVYTARDVRAERFTISQEIDSETTVSELHIPFALIESISVDGVALEEGSFSNNIDDGIITFNPAIEAQSGTIIAVTGYQTQGEWSSSSWNLPNTAENRAKYYDGSVFTIEKGIVAQTYVRQVITANLGIVNMPMNVTVTGAGESGTTVLSIVRAEDYHLYRPDDTTFDGYEGEIVASASQYGEAAITITVDDLIGHLDDGTNYILVASVTDVYGQTATERIPFRVNWLHKAEEPGVTVVMDKVQRIAKITPIAPSNYAQGDTCDIYRITADQPELIVKGAEFGTTYVDPYPAFGDFCGHRIVTITSNGDYATATGLGWYDADYVDGDILDDNNLVIDVDGDQIVLPYNLTLSNTWNKDFKRTAYLGGAVQGDWNPAITRDLSAGTVIVRGDDLDRQLMIRDLAGYAGVAHVRTPDGSSLTADVQINETQSYDSRAITYSMTIKAIDPSEPVGMTLEMWNSLHPIDE